VSIRVLLADDQAMIRGGLRLILEDQPDITVVAEAADGTEAIRLARQLRPDVCLIDIRMPGKDGIEVTRAIAGPGVADPLRVVIVQAIAKGRTNAEIAADLFISLSTVKSHLNSIHNKLGVRNRVEIAGWAWETRLIQPASG
jgi:DNA-binding NarL/FixJ family response regulator